MIFDDKILTNKVIGYHYCLITLIDRQFFKGGQYGENYSLQELRDLNFTNYEELSIIIEMLNKLESSVTVNLDDYCFIRDGESYKVYYKDQEILMLDELSLKELTEELKNPNSGIVKSQYATEEFNNKATFFKDKYHSDLSKCDVLLFVDSGNEWQLNGLKV